METLTLVARQLFLFAHLIAFALAFAAILAEDLALLSSRQIDQDKLVATGRTIVRLLATLWITGATLIVMDVGWDLAALLDRPKLLTKLTVVSVLTLNGWLLHQFAFPVMTSPSLDKPGHGATLCAVLGAVSSVSWLYASFVGVARLIAPKLGLLGFMSTYVMCLATGVAVGLLVARPKLVALLQAQAERQDALPASATVVPLGAPPAAQAVVAEAAQRPELAAA